MPLLVLRSLVARAPNDSLGATSDGIALRALCSPFIGKVTTKASMIVWVSIRSPQGGAAIDASWETCSVTCDGGGAIGGSCAQLKGVRTHAAIDVPLRLDTPSLFGMGPWN